MEINGEAIYSTRPWKTYGEGPNAVKSGSFQGDSIANLGAKDIRFTSNKANTNLYAIALGWPREAFLVRALGTASDARPGKIRSVSLVGTEARVSWKQTAEGLRVELPAPYLPASDFAAALKIEWA
jgi:alpha-L-fucosidase